MSIAPRATTPRLPVIHPDSLVAVLDANVLYPQWLRGLLPISTTQEHVATKRSGSSVVTGS